MNKKIIKNIIFFIFVLILLSIQSTNILAIYEVNPDFLLIMTILFSFQYGEFKGQIFGFVYGLLEDTLVSGLFGLNALILTLIAYLTYIYRKYILVSDIISFILFLLVATIIKYFLYIIFHWIFKIGNLMDWMLLLKMSFEIVYNVFAGILLYYVFLLIFKKEEEYF